MNQVKKIYCRIFQKAFHLVIPILPYRQPKKVEHLADIPSILKEKGVDRILIVTDQGIRSHGLLEPLEKALRENHIFYEIDEARLGESDIFHVGFKSTLLYHLHYGFDGIFLVLFVGMRL